jgi:hypothetical protein
MYTCFVAIWVWNLVSHPERRTQIEDELKWVLKRTVGPKREEVR